MIRTLDGGVGGGYAAPMRLLGATLLVCLSLGCSPGAGAESSGTTTGDPGGTVGFSTSGSGDVPTTDPAPTATGSTAPGDSTTGSTTDLTTDATSSADTSTSTTGDDATTGAAICDPIEPALDVFLVHDGKDPGCGRLEFTGVRTGEQPGPEYKLDSCPCNSACESPDPWTLTIVGSGALPVMPECPQIVVERAPTDRGCELVGAWISEGPELNVGLGLWNVGRTLTPIDPIAAELAIEALPFDTCECDDCCETATRFRLRFTAGDASVTVAESNEAVLERGESFRARNNHSRMTGVCDAPPLIDWLLEPS